MRKVAAYLINVAVCAAIAVGVIFLRGVLREETASGIMRCLSDGFVAAGAASLLCAALVLISRQGLLDAFAFTCRRIWVSLHDREYREKNKMTYAEYREKKGARRSSYRHLWIVGAAFLALGVLFTVLFYVV